MEMQFGKECMEIAILANGGTTNIWPHISAKTNFHFDCFKINIHFNIIEASLYCMPNLDSLYK